MACDLASAHAHHQDQRTKAQSLEWAATGHATPPPVFSIGVMLLDVHKRHHEPKESGANFPPLGVPMRGLWAGEHTPPVAARSAILGVVNAATGPPMTQGSLAVFHLDCALDGRPRTCAPGDCKVYYSPNTGVTVHGPGGTTHESPASPTIPESGYLTARPDGPDSGGTGPSGDPDGDDQSTPPIQQSRKRTQPQLSPPTAQRRLLDASPPPAGTRSSNRLAVPTVAAARCTPDANPAHHSIAPHPKTTKINGIGTSLSVQLHCRLMRRR